MRPKLVNGHDDRQLFLYEGSQHLFADRSLSSYDCDDWGDKNPPIWKALVSASQE